MVVFPIRRHRHVSSDSSSGRLWLQAGLFQRFDSYELESHCLMLFVVFVTTSDLRFWCRSGSKVSSSLRVCPHKDRRTWTCVCCINTVLRAAASNYSHNALSLSLAPPPPLPPQTHNECVCDTSGPGESSGLRGSRCSVPVPCLVLAALRGFGGMLGMLLLMR